MKLKLKYIGEALSPRGVTRRPVSSMMNRQLFYPYQEHANSKPRIVPVGDANLFVSSAMRWSIESIGPACDLNLSGTKSACRETLV